MTDKTQPEALRLADAIKASGQFTNLHTLDEASAELRRQHARIAELEAARFAYASEFEPNGDGDTDVGSIHANIRAMKAKLASIGAALSARTPTAPLSDDADRLREALQRIEGASMSMYATRSDMLEHCQDIARAALAAQGGKA